jgi:RND family efflux transporter MFP subunit
MQALLNITPAWVARTSAAAMLLAALPLAGCSKAPPAAENKVPLVSVTQTRAVDIPVDFAAQGHIVPLNFVDVRPQLTGTIMTVNFHEGDDVKPGQLLFTLDDSDARAQLARADAQAAMIAAQLADARREHMRAQELVKSRFVAVSAVDTAASKVDALAAQLRAAQADANSARTTLSHTRIAAPIAGKAGAVTAHPGSLAQAGAGAPLVTIAQFDPVGVEFSLPEQAMPALLQARAQGPVRVSLDAPRDAATDGQLVFINNTISQDSASIGLKASFPNGRHGLWPGGFVRIVVHAGQSRGAVVLPPQAVQDGPAGRFVFLVDGDSKVASKPVELLRIQDGMAVIAGLGAGVTVVLEGGQNLRPGKRVRVAAGDTQAAAMVAR